MGFKDLADPANTVTTTAGGVDALVRARQANMFFGNGAKGLGNALGRFSLASGHSAAKAVPGMPVSNGIGAAGAALSLLGLGGDIWDMAENGVDVENSLSAATNATGALGAVSPHSAALSAGLQIGRRGDKRLGLSDKASDLGLWIDEKLGGGALGTAGGVVGTALGSAASVPFAAAGGLYDLGAGGVNAVEGVGRAALGLDHPLLASVREQVSAEREGDDR